jgi:ABC-type bacteriocin/lantibiotic exporter with double-glycine peptidase domain
MKIKPGLPMKWSTVVQEEATGCGIAASAALARISYAEAKRVAAQMGISAADKRLWSSTDWVVGLLGELGIGVQPEPIPFTAWHDLPDCALLAIKWHLENDRPFWHWVVFIRQADGQAYVLDSKAALKQHLRTDFGRMKPKWFLNVALEVI